jgi:Fe-S oxidoreductase
LSIRHSIVQKKHTPDLFKVTAKNIFEVGDPSGMPPSKRVTWARQLPQKGIFPQEAPILYWAGCVAAIRTPNTAKAVGNVLNKAHVEFTHLGEKEGCCGYVLIASGLWDEAKENALKLIDRLSQTRADTLITTCAGCYYTFTKTYPEILGIELPCKVQHATQYMERLINEKTIVPRDLPWSVTYHDPCSLGRHSNVYNSPRNVLNAVPKLSFIEMPLKRNRSRCCGAGGGLWSYNNTVANDCATERLVKDAVPLGVSALTTACPTCHINLRNAAARNTPEIKIYDIIELVDLSIS